MGRALSTQILILPGIGNSGPQHWQSLWEATGPSFRRVAQRDWDNPICSEWQAQLQAAVESAGPNTVLVAHSLACLVVAHWVATSNHRIKAALLVAVPNPLGPSFPPEAIGFAPVPKQAFPFPSVVVASTDDPYGTLEHSRECASSWGSRLVTIGAAGHINAASGLGSWSEGYALLQSLLTQPGVQADRP
jgi:predicted alpha/beta hydrolase family esterase